MLPPFYELGRSAAFSAMDAHDEAIDLRADTMLQAAYQIAAEAEAEAEGGLRDLPENVTDLAPRDREQFLLGYFETLEEANRY